MTDTTDQQAVTVVQAQLCKRVFLHAHSDGWTGNQMRRDVQHVDAEKSWSVYVSNGALAKSIEATTPEPVPATNQAGEVAKIARDHVEAFIVQSRLGGLMDGDETLLTSLFRQAMFAALATQPATSQEGEGKTWSEIKDTCPITRAKFKVRTADIIKNKTVRIDVADLRHLLSLAATPTPPTLSEDLREIPDEVFRKIADAKDVGTCRARVANLLAALAQVKAS